MRSFVKEVLILRADEGGSNDAANLSANDIESLARIRHRYNAAGL